MSPPIDGPETAEPGTIMCSDATACYAQEVGDLCTAYPAPGEPGGLASVHRPTTDRVLGAEAVQHASAYGRAGSPLAAHGAADRPQVR